MILSDKKIAITGVSGFIGSHLADALISKGNEVIGIDNFSSGKREFIAHLLKHKNFHLHERDLLKTSDLSNLLDDCDIVFHLAADPDVRVGAENTRVHLEQNIITTYNLLEGIRKSGVKKIIFTSTSTVYGETDVIPTPEDHGPLIPISLYGSSKLACEAMISSYCYTFNFSSVIYRFANVVGPRSTHGVIFDFINKLQKKPTSLEILGRKPGTRKSYFHISDCIDGMIFGCEHSKQKVEIFNMGSEDHIEVEKIADIVCNAMGLKNVKYEWTGGVDNGRGWIGDVKIMLLSIDKLKKRGWKPKYDSEEAVRLTAFDLLK